MTDGEACSHCIAMSSTEEALCYLGIVSYYALKTCKKIRHRKVWVKHWLTKRERLSHVNLVRELREEKEDFLNYFRMPELVYKELFTSVSFSLYSASNILSLSLLAVSCSQLSILSNDCSPVNKSFI